MKNDMAKAFSIASIWISTSLIFIFGVFGYEATGDVQKLILILVTIGMVGITFVSTLFVLKYWGDAK